MKGVSLRGDVTFTGTQFVIENRTDEDWHDVRLEINGGMLTSGYLYHADSIAAGRALTVGALLFTNSDHVRFNPFQLKADKLTVSCTLPDGASGFATFRWQ
jgi:hypothetical protein